MSSKILRILGPILGTFERLYVPTGIKLDLVQYRRNFFSLRSDVFNMKIQRSWLTRGSQGMSVIGGISVRVYYAICKITEIWGTIVRKYRSPSEKIE